MSTHTRRTALFTLATAAAAPVIFKAGSGFAQEAAAPADGGEYATQTLMLGSFSMMTSEVARQKATDPMVKQFAELEAAEQATVAEILSSTGAQPPALPEDRAQMLADMEAMEAGPEFDMAYVEGQIATHQELLAIQQTMSGATEMSVEVITAKLGEQAINSHIAMLQNIQQMMGAQG